MELLAVTQDRNASALPDQTRLTVPGGQKKTSDQLSNNVVNMPVKISEGLNRFNNEIASVLSSELNEEEGSELVKESQIDSDFPRSRKVEFNVDKDSGRMSIAVIDRDTDEVIREIPPQRVLDVLKKLRETMGHVVDHQA